MCATKPIAGWPQPPSRSSSSACALAGTRIWPFQMFSASSRSGDGRVVGQHHRTGVRHRHRHRAHRHGQPHPELLDDGADRERERLPVRVGLRTVHQQVRRAEAVVVEAHHQPGRLVVLVAALRERHRRADGRGSRRTRRCRSWRPPAPTTGPAAPASRARPRCRRRGTRPASGSAPAPARASSSSGTSSTMCTYLAGSVIGSLCHPSVAPSWSSLSRPSTPLRSSLCPIRSADLVRPGARAARPTAADPERAEPMQAYMKSAMPYRGVTSAPLRSPLPGGVRRAAAARPRRLGVVRAGAVGRRDLPRGALRGAGADPAPALPGLPGPGDARPLPAPGRLWRLVGLRRPGRQPQRRRPPRRPPGRGHAR